MSVTIEGKARTVGRAGVRFAGVFQANVCVQNPTRSGDLPVVLWIGNQPTPAGAVLPFVPP